MIAPRARRASSLVLAMVTLGAAAPLPDVAAERTYASAVAAMRALASPPFATYRESWSSSGAGMQLVGDDGEVHIAIGAGRSFRDRRLYDVAFRSEGRLLAARDLSDPAGPATVGRGSPLLDPTWRGAYETLRSGLRPSPAASSAPAAAASDAPEASDVAAASAVAISPLYYAVSSAGPRACANGDAGQALTLRALRDRRDHPLSGVIVDATDGRFCEMRFDLDESGVAGILGDYTLRFAGAGGAWLVMSGRIDVTVRLLGIAAKHVVLDWQLSDVATPLALPVDTFATPSPAPKR